jgi:hypothetical protein
MARRTSGPVEILDLRTKRFSKKPCSSSRNFGRRQWNGPSRDERPSPVRSKSHILVCIAINGLWRARAATEPERLEMVGIADRPAAPSISNLHELNRSRCEQWLQIPALPLIANVLVVGVLLFDRISRPGLVSLRPQLGHFGFAALSWLENDIDAARECGAAGKSS